MARFRTTREKRIWLLVSAIVMLIFATLGLAGSISGLLRSSGLLAPAFILGFLLVILAVATQGLKVRPRGMEIGIVLGFSAVFLLLFVRVSLPEERTHLVEYGVLGLLIFEGLVERFGQSWRRVRIVVAAVAATTLIGTIDEVIQWLIPNRVFDSADILFNFLAGAAAVATGATLNAIRRRADKAPAA